MLYFQDPTLTLEESQPASLEPSATSGAEASGPAPEPGPSTSTTPATAGSSTPGSRAESRSTPAGEAWPNITLPRGLTVENTTSGMRVDIPVMEAEQGATGEQGLEGQGDAPHPGEQGQGDGDQELGDITNQHGGQAQEDREVLRDLQRLREASIPILILRDRSPEVPSLEDAYAATRRQIEGELQLARDRAREPEDHTDQPDVLPQGEAHHDQPDVPRHGQVHDAHRPDQGEAHDARHPGLAGVQEAHRPGQAEARDGRRQGQAEDDGDVRHPRAQHHAGRVPDVMPPLRRPAAQLHRDLALRGQRGRQRERMEMGHQPQQHQFRVPGPRHQAQRLHHPHSPNPRGRGHSGGRGRRSRSRSSLGRIQRELESVARQRRQVQQELALTRSELELIDLRRMVLRSDRERGVRELVDRGRPLGPVSVSTIPGSHARQILDLASPGLRDRAAQRQQLEDTGMDAGTQARLRRLRRRQQKERARLERDEVMRRTLREFPWSMQYGSPLGPAQYLGQARRQALLELARTAERVASHPGLTSAWG